MKCPTWVLLSDKSLLCHLFQGKKISRTVKAAEMLIPQTFLSVAVLWSLNVSPVCIQHCSHKGDCYILGCCRLFLTCFEEITLAHVAVCLLEVHSWGKVSLVIQTWLFLQIKLKEAPKTKWTLLLVQEKMQNRSVKFVSLRLSHWSVFSIVQSSARFMCWNG